MYIATVSICEGIHGFYIGIVKWPLLKSLYGIHMVVELLVRALGNSS